MAFLHCHGTGYNPIAQAESADVSHARTGKEQKTVLRSRVATEEELGSSC